MDRPQLEALTALRFFAASHVIVYHFFYPEPDGWLDTLVAAGPLSVTFFFVLSGFVLAYVYGDRTTRNGRLRSIRDYASARVARIVPAYMLALLISAPLFLHAGLVARSVPFDAFLTALFTTPMLLQSFWPASTVLWNGPGWSLSVEAFLYLLFPVVLRITWSASPRRALAIAFASVLLVGAIRELFLPEGGGPATQWDGRWNFYAYFPVFHLPAFVAGVACARLFTGAVQPGVAAARCLLAASCLMVLGLFLAEPHTSPSVFGTLPLIPLFCAIVYAAAVPGCVPLGRTARVMLPLGEASYSMYILHMPLYSWWHWVVERRLDLDLAPLTSFVGYYALVVAASIAVHVWIEAPVRSRMRRPAAFGGAA